MRRSKQIAVASCGFRKEGLLAEGSPIAGTRLEALSRRLAREAKLPAAQAVSFSVARRGLLAMRVSPGRAPGLAT